MFAYKFSKQPRGRTVKFQVKSNLAPSELWGGPSELWGVQLQIQVAQKIPKL